MILFFDCSDTYVIGVILKKGSKEFEDLAHMMSPSLSLVWMRAHDLWSEVVTALRRLVGALGDGGAGEEPRRPPRPRCRPPAPPSILKSDQCTVSVKFACARSIDDSVGRLPGDKK